MIYDIPTNRPPANDIRDAADIIETATEYAMSKEPRPDYREIMLAMAKRLRAFADVLERHEGELEECDHGRLSGKCGICDDDE